MSAERSFIHKQQELELELERNIIAIYQPRIYAASPTNEAINSRIPGSKIWHCCQIGCRLGAALSGVWAVFCDQDV